MLLKTRIKAIRYAALAVAAATIAAQTQAQQPPAGAVTRAQVQKELADLESVGYDPTADDHQYPSELDAAEQRLALKNEVQHEASAGIPAQH